MAVETVLSCDGQERMHTPLTRTCYFRSIVCGESSSRKEIIVRRPSVVYFTLAFVHLTLNGLHGIQHVILVGEPCYPLNSYLRYWQLPFSARWQVPQWCPAAPETTYHKFATPYFDSMGVWLYHELLSQTTDAT